MMANKYFKLFLVSVIMMLIGTSSVLADVYKLRANHLSYRFNIDSVWTEWSEWEETNVLITVNFDKERITIYSKETQVYDIAKDEGKEIDSDGDTNYSYYCIDNDGVACRVKMVFIEKNNEIQLYINYSDIQCVYNVYILD